MIRLDLFLAGIPGAVRSRTEAQQLIRGGKVMLDGKTVLLPSFPVTEDTDPSRVTLLRGEENYASRGGLKLAAALQAFPASPDGLVCLDVGASTGGFTDCLLRHGARHVYALDAGSGQLIDALRADSRVTVYENYNARTLDIRDFPLGVEFATMDVSFISQTLILPSLTALLPRGGSLITLVKPQFELDRSALGKKGIVKDDALRKKALRRVLDCAAGLGLVCMGQIHSPISGGDGNIEYLIYFRKGESDEHQKSDFDSERAKR